MSAAAQYGSISVSSPVFGRSLLPVAAPDRITISGLEAGDVVSFDVQAGALDMGGASKYYAKGIRESGRDNSTVTASAFKVDGDADYVMAYGMKGNSCVPEPPDACVSSAVSFT